MFRMYCQFCTKLFVKNVKTQKAPNFLAYKIPISRGCYLKQRKSAQQWVDVALIFREIIFGKGYGNSAQPRNLFLFSPLKNLKQGLQDPPIL